MPTNEQENLSEDVHRGGRGHSVVVVLRRERVFPEGESQAVGEEGAGPALSVCQLPQVFSGSRPSARAMTGLRMASRIPGNDSISFAYVSASG